MLYSAVLGESVHRTPPQLGPGDSEVDEARAAHGVVLLFCPCSGKLPIYGGEVSGVCTEPGTAELPLLPASPELRCLRTQLASQPQEMFWQAAVINLWNDRGGFVFPLVLFRKEPCETQPQMVVHGGDA